MKKIWILFLSLGALSLSVLSLAISCSYDLDVVETLQASPASGYTFPLIGGEVTLASATAGAVIYYTTGDGNPDQVYTGPITVTRPLTIRAMAKKEDMTDSETITASYTIETNTTLDFVASMKIGWNLGNTLDGHNNQNPSETIWQSTVTTQTLMNGVAAQGFGAVRIPVTWLNKIGAAPDYTIDADWMNRVAEIVEYVRVAGMKAIINIHHDGADSAYWLSVKQEDLTGENKTAIDEKFSAVWTQIAEKFKDTGDYLLFESFNELHDGSWGDGADEQHERVNELNQIFVDTVRAAGGENSERYLVIPGWVTRPSVTVSALVPPEDTAKNKLIVSIHYYDPYEFTGSAEQQVWGDKALPGDWANESYVQSTFHSVRDKFVGEGIPVIIGEYGAVNQSGNAFAYREYYMEYVTKHAVQCRFIPFYWDNAGFGSGSEKFGLLDRATGAPHDADAEKIIEVMMEAVYKDYSMEDILAP